jgi:hypothetical protein
MNDLRINPAGINALVKKIWLRAAMMFGGIVLMFVAFLQQSIILAAIGFVLVFAGVQPKTKKRRVD